VGSSYQARLCPGPRPCLASSLLRLCTYIHASRTQGARAYNVLQCARQRRSGAVDSDTCVVAPLHAQLGTVLFVTQLHASPGLVPPQGGICMYVCVYVCVYVCMCVCMYTQSYHRKKKKNNYVAGMRRRRARRWTPRGEKQLEESCPLGLGRWACRTGKTCLRKKKEKSKEALTSTEF
jgi:hypothetical protein